MKLSKNNNRFLQAGFTLVELIAVIAIIGIIAAIAVNRYSAVVGDARVAKQSSVVSIVEKAKDLYVADEARTVAQLLVYNGTADANKYTTLQQYIQLNGTINPTSASLLTGTGMTQILPGKVAIPAALNGGTAVSAEAVSLK
ncbi:MAG: hypothetical protein RLZZ244_2175 [Verrucomicrobiota bacterium]|jgi:prepilin-type N-terminal cleavage/methylation domain-containing protein